MGAVCKGASTKNFRRTLRILWVGVEWWWGVGVQWIHKKKNLWQISLLNEVLNICEKCYLQASVYEACDSKHLSLHMPKTLETCKTSTTYLIRKASRHAADCTPKTSTCFISDGRKAIVEQILPSEEINPKEQTGIRVWKLTIWVRSPEMEKL